MDMVTDSIYEEEAVEGNIKLEQQTDSEEGEMMHEEIVLGQELHTEEEEEVASEQHLEEVLIQTHSGGGRLVQKRINAKAPVLLRRNVEAANRQQQQHDGHSGGGGVKLVSPTQGKTYKIISSGGPRIISVPKLSNLKITNVGVNQQQTGAAALPVKRKSDGSPLVHVKLDDLKRFRTIPLNQLGAAQNTASSQILKTAGVALAGAGSKNIKVVKPSHTQTDISGEILDQYQQIIEEDHQKIAQLEEQVRLLKYTPEMFENDDKRTEYYTGIDSFLTMITLFNSCESELPYSSTLTKFEIFILTLLKLRLKLPIPYLGYQFGVSPKAVNYYFNECLSVLHCSLRELFASDDADAK